MLRYAPRRLPQVSSFTPSAIALGTLFAIAVGLTASRSRISDGELISVNRLVLLASGAQLLHFLEEAIFELNVRLPQAFGLPAMSFSFFLTINIAALVVWLWGALQRTFNPVVITTFWFLGLASVFNLLAHPTMAIRSGGYFPGLVTSPLVGVMGLLLTRRLWTATKGAIGSSETA